MKSKDTINILFCGIGGQGVLTASEVAAWAAIYAGYHVKKSEVHGMSQRGGSVDSHLRFGQDVFSPLIPAKQADYLVCFDQGEHAVKKNFLKPNGRDLIAALEDGQRIAADKRYLNIFLLGRLSQYLKIEEKDWIMALERIFSQRYLPQNKRVFYLGRGEGI
ncbi:MAG: indolepyruvate oxidoreductase subunit beta [Candidatus Omnitrophota bacterium]